MFSHSWESSSKLGICYGFTLGTFPILMFSNFWEPCRRVVCIVHPPRVSLPLGAPIIRRPPARRVHDSAIRSPACVWCTLRGSLSRSGPPLDGGPARGGCNLAPNLDSAVEFKIGNLHFQTFSNSLGSWFSHFRESSTLGNLHFQVFPHSWESCCPRSPAASAPPLCF